ncbi:uncharacterized protein [Hetaerina americana]|uniref:uncharacterized protein n=1 Tax=Hetaerina americana TaxID=62018 RepID=UPI003A7F3184
MSQAIVLELTEEDNRNEVRCDKCHSPYAIDPAKRKKTSGDSLPKPRFRKRLDVETNKVLILCNKCGLKMSRLKKRPPKKPLPSDEEKNCYLEEAKMFAESLAETLQDPDAKTLFCPNVKSNPCGCLQRYIKGGEEDFAKIPERAFFLMSLLKNAKDLSTEKMHTASSSGVSGNSSVKSDAILCRGIGNRHSKMFEEFVLSNRKFLREQLKLCERASQKVLLYSNNFLHKELKSMKNQRVERKSSKYAKMKPIAELASISCCKDQCGQQAITQPDMLETWRLSAQEGQREARRVIAEMLTPSSGSKSNCYRFISSVTGCSFTTICSVNNHLKKTSGSMDPPEHGLKKWWRENPKKIRRKEGPSTKKSMKTGDDEDVLELEAAVVDSDLMTPRSSLPPPPYETVLCSKESVLQASEKELSGHMGFPSVGKSTLLSNLAGVYSEVAAYEFTTLTTVPGCIKYKGAKIQLLDLPGIIEGAKDGKGRGRQVIAVARTCSLIFIVLDVLKPLQHKKLIEHELEGFGLRLNKRPPNIGFRKKDKGGINLQQLVTQTELDLDMVKTILAEYRISNADITLRYDATSDDLIDVIEGNRVYIPCIYLLNKIDQISIEELDVIYKIPHCVPISAHHKWNFDDLLEKMWLYLKLIRIYTKPKGQLPDYAAPVVLHSDRRSIEDFCNKLHRTIAKEFKYALVWGSSVKHQPQKVGKDHILNDEDVVQIVKKV